MIVVYISLAVMLLGVLVLMCQPPGHSRAELPALILVMLGAVAMVISAFVVVLA